MDEDLVGYLLNALEPEEERRVEAHLEARPEARVRLEALRRALAPLRADADEFEPPAGLAERTLARVAATAGGELPHAPRPVNRAAASGRPAWRRADVLVAASVLIVAAGLGLSLLFRLREGHDVLACQNNLREFFIALKTYSEQHRGDFPDVAHAAQPPRNVAGLVVPILASEGELPRDANVRCPSCGAPAAPAGTLEQVLKMSDEEFGQECVRLGYAYSLGYRDQGGRYRGPRFDPEQPSAEIPLMSDRPPMDLRVVNSPNHGGRGQNVLFMDGHVRFCTHRAVGVGGDDIFVNRDNEVAAGLDELDAVLGRGTANPFGAR
jgi:prepilin-type processing-associated H-X9-DG protein